MRAMIDIKFNQNTYNFFIVKLFIYIITVVIPFIILIVIDKVKYDEMFHFNLIICYVGSVTFFGEEMINLYE